jgi:hypothetical protein
VLYPAAALGCPGSRPGGVVASAKLPKTGRTLRSSAG